MSVFQLARKATVERRCSLTAAGDVNNSFTVSCVGVELAAFCTPRGLGKNKCHVQTMWCRFIVHLLACFEITGLLWATKKMLPSQFSLLHKEGEIFPLVCRPPSVCACIAALTEELCVHCHSAIVPHTFQLFSTLSYFTVVEQGANQ